MRMLIERRIEEKHQNIGPAHDPYARDTVEILERYNDGLQFRIALVSCGLADALRLVVDNEILLDFGEATDGDVREEFKRIAGISVDRLHKVLGQREYDQDPYYGHP